MHQLVGIIGRAENRADAVAQAYTYADSLIEHGEFDYYMVEDEVNVRTYSLAEEAGKLLVAEALKANRREFDLAMYAVKQMLKHYSAEQIYQEDFPDEKRDYFASRHEFAVVGGATTDCFIYGDGSVWGGKILNDRDYAVATNETEPGELWITALGMHH